LQNYVKHLTNIKTTYQNLLVLAEDFDDKTKKELYNSLNHKYKLYIKQFEDIFEPKKTIDEDMKYFADIRTLSKYNENIISGWLVEDFFIFLFDLDIFKEHDFTLKFNSHDSDRIIKKERKYINSEPDFNIIHKNIEFKVEIQALLIPYNKFHIKQNKTDRLIKYNSFLLCLLLSRGEIVFFYPDDIDSLGSLTSIKAFGGKKGYEYIIDNIPKNKILTKSNLLQKILIIFYWFYCYKVLDKQDFNHFMQKIKNNYKSIDILLEKLKKNDIEIN